MHLKIKILEDYIETVLETFLPCSQHHHLFVIILKCPLSIVFTFQTLMNHHVMHMFQLLYQTYQK